jgi:hypothetical protein
MAKIYKIETETGLGFSYDMLRYDDGMVIQMETDKAGNVKAIVECGRYTPARWDSFCVQTRILETRTVGKKEYMAEQEVNPLMSEKKKTTGGRKR